MSRCKYEGQICRPHEDPSLQTHAVPPDIARRSINRNRSRSFAQDFSMGNISAYRERDLVVDALGESKPANLANRFGIGVAIRKPSGLLPRAL